MRFACPYCNQHIEADDDMAGETIHCPFCQRQITIPAQSTLPPKMPTPEPAPPGAVPPIIAS
ncbi:MAG: hypothetical protein FJ395_06950 [Verrucomicrobia bacterium]|nr:hypothetical protein [Verrucomicrobiota bacterium]